MIRRRCRTTALGVPPPAITATWPENLSVFTDNPLVPCWMSAGFPEIAPSDREFPPPCRIPG